MKTLFSKLNLGRAAVGLGLLLAPSAIGQTNPQFIGALQPDERASRLTRVPNQVNAHLKKYGYMDMTFRQYNHAGDWP